MAATKGKTGKTAKTAAKKPENKVDSKAVTTTDKQELLPYNPLLSNPVILPEDENEKKAQLIEEIESLTALNKQALQAKKQQMEVFVDDKKLDAAKQTVQNLENILDILSDPKVLENVKKNTKKPYDYKVLSEALMKQTEALKAYMDPTIQDEFGRRKRTKIIAEFRTASGEEARIAAELPGSD